MDTFQTVTDGNGSLQDNRVSFKTARSILGVKTTVLKEERAKLWGMFKLKPKVIKIIVCKKQGEDLKDPTD